MIIYTLETATQEITTLKNNYFNPYFRISKNIELVNWLTSHILKEFLLNELTIEAMVYLLLNPTTATICPYGRTKHYRADRKNFFCVFGCDCTKDKIVNTFTNTYGVTHPAKSSVIKEKRKQTMMNTYGVEHALQSPAILSKSQNTNMTRYNSHHYVTTNQFKTQYKETCLANYGVAHPSQCDLVKDRKKKTMIQLYGCSNFQQRHLSKDTLNILQDKELFKQILSSYNVFEMANHLMVSKSTIRATCRKFELTPRSMLSHYENELANYFTRNNLSFVKTRKIIYPYELDFYADNYKVAIEFNGTFWHMDPRFYNHDDINPVTKKSANQHWAHDSIKKNKCNIKNINLLTIWEHDWNTNKEQCISRIHEAIS